MDTLRKQVAESLATLTGAGSSFRDLKYLLAVSGGKDSMAMAHLFLSMNLHIGVAHFNFHLRGEDSVKDAELVRRFCEEHRIPFHQEDADTYREAGEMKLSVQETARELRYRFFEKIRTGDGYDFICTAHHANDQLETFFLHLFRAGGLKGLSGIPARRDYILRPLLEIPLTALKQYLEKNGIEYREDASNLSDDYQRNKIRHHVTEPLLSRDPQLLENALTSMRYIREASEYLDTLTRQFGETFCRDFTASVTRIEWQNPDLFRPENLFLLREYLRKAGLYPDSIRDLTDPDATLRTGNKYEGKNLSAFFDRDRLWLVAHDFYKSWDATDRIALPDKGETTLPGGDRIIFLPAAETEILSSSWWTFVPDPAVVIFPLRARHRRPGDRIVLGQPPYFRKEIKKLFNEHRIPLPFKDRIYLITDADDRIVSIPGLANSSKYCLADPGGQQVWGFESALKSFFSDF